MAKKYYQLIQDLLRAHYALDRFEKKDRVKHQRFIDESVLDLSAEKRAKVPGEKELLERVIRGFQFRDVKLSKQEIFDVLDFSGLPFTESDLERAMKRRKRPKITR